MKGPPPPLWHARSWLEGRVRAVLEDRWRALDQARTEALAIGAQSVALDQRLARLEARLRSLQEEIDLRGQPFSAALTLDRTLRRHPDARRILARFHLPSCDGCAVRFEETLEEAADAYGLDLEQLIAELNGLLPPAPSAGPDAV